jgi:uncharacterized protein YlxW (UPF0749 family)
MGKRVQSKLLIAKCRHIEALGWKFTQVIGLRNQLEEKIKALEEEKAALLEEIVQLKEVVVLNDKARDLENEVSELKTEVKALRERIPSKLLQELIEAASPVVEEESDEEKDFGEECENCENCREEEEQF